MKKPGLLLTLLLWCMTGWSDDGYRLWLKYDKIQNATLLANYKKAIGSIYLNAGASTICSSAIQELKSGLENLTGKKIIEAKSISPSSQIILSIIKPGGVINHEEGYHLYRDKLNIRVDALTDRGILYGAFTLLRWIQSHNSIEKININESPK